MRYDVEVRSHLNGGWERRYYTIEAETGDQAASRAKTRAARVLPDASVHLSYTVRPAESDGEMPVKKAETKPKSTPRPAKAVTSKKSQSR